MRPRGHMPFRIAARQLHRLIEQGNQKMRLFVRPYYGVTQSSGFDDICRWLNTPYGADAFADRHWMSQHLQIRLGKRRLPDFIGHYEDLREDLAAVASHLGMPMPRLPMLNTAAGDHPQRLSLERARAERGRYLTEECMALLRRRYARDFELGGYAG